MSSSGQGQSQVRFGQVRFLFFSPPPPPNHPPNKLLRGLDKSDGSRIGWYDSSIKYSQRRLVLQGELQGRHQVGLQGGVLQRVLEGVRCQSYQMDPARVSRSQELSRLVSGLGLRLQRFQGKEGSFQGKRGRKLPREGRKEAS